MTRCHERAARVWVREWQRKRRQEESQMISINFTEALV
jgi:hypothetical protein